MYNRNYGGFDYVRHEHEVRTGEAIHSELRALSAKPKNNNLKPVTDGYTKPLAVI